MNAPKHSPENNYQRDGFMRVDAMVAADLITGQIFLVVLFQILLFWNHHLKYRDLQPVRLTDAPTMTLYSQARDFMTDQDRENLIGNIVSHLSSAQKRIQLRQTALFFKADPDYGSRVTKGLSLDIKEVKRLVNMTGEERARVTEK